MARQKQVFTNDQITGKFLEQSQEYGRTSNESMYFRNNVMYSYGSHFVMAVLVGNDLLIAQRKSSVTTNKHIASLSSDASRAGFNVVEVLNVEASTDEEHANNIADLESQLEHAKAKASRARTPSNVDYWECVAAGTGQAIIKYLEIISRRIAKVA